MTRALLLIVGCLSTALGVVGAFLPLLPTTPFLILAAACFARSSPRFHAALLGNRIVGPYLDQWQQDHTVPRRAKRKACGLILLSFGFSIAVVGSMPLRCVLLGIGLVLLVIVLRLRTRDEMRRPEDPTSDQA